MVFQLESGRDEIQSLILKSLIFSGGHKPSKNIFWNVQPIFPGPCLGAHSSLPSFRDRCGQEKQSPTFHFYREAIPPLAYCVSRAFSPVFLGCLEFFLQAPNFCSTRGLKAKGGNDPEEEDKWLDINIIVCLISRRCSPGGTSRQEGD